MMNFDHGSSASHQQLCERCQDLDVLQFLQRDIPWSSTTELNQAKLSWNDQTCFKSLGRVGSIKFREDCTLCCCLFALTPHPVSSDQEVLMFPFWTMNRLAGETRYIIDQETCPQSAKCLLVTLEPSPDNMEFATRSNRGDALAIAENDLDPSISLGGRQIDTDHINVQMINKWISSCIRLHGADCNLVRTDDLRGIRLVDVTARKIVEYPESSCDYLALSYVWGGVNQGSFQLGSEMGKLPQTIEDSISLVKDLGKRFLWVDSL